MIRLRLLLVVVLSGVLPTQLAAQQRGERDAGRAFLSRAELAELQMRYRGYAESPAYSERLRARARVEAEQIRVRLAEGDFEVGDRVLLIVEGEEALSDTFTVSQGRMLRLSEMGEVRLSGVLRSEFESQVVEHLGRFLREPETRTQSYLRIAVDGAVRNPGFYTAPADMPLADAIMLAGGLAEDAKLLDTRVERGQDRIWTGYPLQDALSGGMTIDQMRLRSGDRVFVPRRRMLNETTVRTLGLLLGIPLSVAALITLF